MSTPITLTLAVDAAAAVRCGESRAGPTKLLLDERDLSQLTPRQRETLARHLERAEGWGAPLTDGAPPIGRADLDALRGLLDARADAMGAPLVHASERVVYRCRECGSIVEDACDAHPAAITDGCIEPRIEDA